VAVPVILAAVAAAAAAAPYMFAAVDATIDFDATIVASTAAYLAFLAAPAHPSRRLYPL